MMGVKERRSKFPLRWLEVADSPAVAALVVTAILCSVGVGSCTNTGASSGGAARRPTAPPAREVPGPKEGAVGASREIRGEPIVRVRLLARTKEVTFSGPAAVLIGPVDRPTEVRGLRTPLKVMRLSSGWSLRDGAGASVLIAGPALGSPAPVLSVRSGGTGLIKVNDAPYPGEFTLLASGALPAAPVAANAAMESNAAAPSASSSLAAFDVVEHVPLETYLPGVVSKELLPNWSLNAFKAQAIAARSYALHERERSLGSGEAFDLESSQLDQVYGGAVEHAVALRAVRETRGVALMTEGRVLRAYYSSTCGGRPSAARHVWPTTKGFEFNLDAPIQGSQGSETACGFSPRYRWTTTRTREDLTRRLAAFGRDQGLAVRGLTSLARVAPDMVTPEGRPLTYKIFETDGRWYPLSAEQLRTACNWSGSSGQPPVNAQTRVYSGDIEVALEGTNFKISGRGFGHGVGLCQYGAEGMSRAGASHMQIVQHYYPGSEIVTLY